MVLDEAYELTEGVPENWAWVIGTSGTWEVTSSTAPFCKLTAYYD